MAEIAGQRVAYLVRSWPRLSQTFILNEALALERGGIELDILSMVPAQEKLVQPQVADVTARVRYLDSAAARPWWSRLAEHLAVARRAPSAYGRTLITVLTGGELADGYANASVLACFGHAVHLSARIHAAARQGRPMSHLHAHFAHDPALVAWLTHRLTGIRFSITAHARDLYGVPAPALAARAADAAAVITCCHTNADYLRQVLPSNQHGRIHVIHHGVDLTVFQPSAARARRGDGVDNDIPRIVSIGRLVEKKGFALLLEACAALVSRGVMFNCTIYGDGPLLASLEAQRDSLGLKNQVTFGGARIQKELVSELQEADVFALTPFVTDDGDRDGVPNVLVEAMACGLPVVTTDAGGITDLLVHGQNGLLSPPHDVTAIADHLALLLGDVGERVRMSLVARQSVEDGFNIEAAASRLSGIFSGRP